jgi:hypothetical protein
MYFDSHFHSEGIGFSEIRKMAEAKIVEACSVAFYPVKPLYAETMIDLFRKLIEFEPRRCEAAGLKLHVAVGIHPRCIPQSYKKALEFVENMEVEGWVAFGEIGLEKGTSLEIEVLQEQLKIAERLDVPCIIHTPRANKKTITEKILSILEKMNFPDSLAVIDHVNFETLDMVYRTGYKIGLTVQPGKLSPKDVLRIVEGREIEKFVINSDAGFSDSDFIAVSKAARFLEANVEKDVVRRVAFENAKEFLRV